MAGLDRNAKIIFLGDKLSNIREIGRDYRLLGDALWERFNQKDKQEHAWYYRSICDVLEAELGTVPEIREYREHLREIFG